jgi:outer membrane protein OmpA-like peptidoglycan-associated protein
MNKYFSKAVWTVGLLSVAGVALAGEVKPTAPQEPAGFVAGGVIGGFAAGPIGAVVGAGLGTWLGNRVHRAGEAARAEARVAALNREKAAVDLENTALSDSNRALTAQIEQLAISVQSAQNLQTEGAALLDGVQGDVLFRTGSAEITPEIARQVEVLAQAVAKSQKLKVRVDGYADPRGTADDNMRLSQARADAVRDLFLAAGVGDSALEVNAYGKSKSVAADGDGYALERRVRLTLQAEGAAAVVQAEPGTGR